MTYITFQDVSISFGNHQILKNIQLEVQPGDFLGITGPSGSGKTTLLKLISGLLRPNQGTVSHCPNLRVSMAFQEPRLLPWRKAWENVALPLIAFGTPKKEAKQQATEWMIKLELEKAIDLYPRQLSGGMAQRLGLARALAIEPQVLLLDEPLSALPEDQRERFINLLASFKESHTERALLYVTHYPEEISDRATGWIKVPGDGLIKYSKEDLTQAT